MKENQFPHHCHKSRGSFPRALDLLKNRADFLKKFFWPYANPGTSGKVSGTLMDLKKPEYYINRELSWLKFNLRVLREAGVRTLPLLERLRFCGYFCFKP